MSALRVSAQSEASLQAAAVELAQLSGWLAYHTLNSRGSQPGFPDLVLVREDRILYRELKSDLGRLSRDQQRWLAALAGAGADVGVWRPADWDAIVQELRRR